MSQVYTPNIVLTNNRELIEKFFFKGENVNQYKPSFNDKDFITLSQNNKYLKSLTYQFGYEKGAKTNLVLELIDVDNKLEESFWDAKIIRDLINRALKIETQNFLFDSAADDVVKSKIEGINTIYFGFGIGDNLREWAGPLIAKLVSAETLITGNGIRGYKFQFQSFISYLNRPSGDLEHSPDDNVIDLSFATPNFIAKATRDIKDDLYSIDFTKNLNALLFDFVSKAIRPEEGPSNVLTLIPDINEAMYTKILNLTDAKKKAIGNFKKNSLFETETLDFEFGVGNVQVPVKVRRGPRFSTGSKVVDTVIDFFKEQTGDYLLDPEEKAKLEAEDKKIVEEYLLSKRDYIYSESVRDVFHLFKFNVNLKFNVTQVIKEIANPLITGKENLYADIRKESLSEKYLHVKNSNLFSIEMYTDKYDLDNPERKFPRWSVPIRNFEEGLRQLGFPGKIIIFEESNMRILKVWKSLGLIASDKYPCVVVGHDGMLKDYLYCNEMNISQVTDYKSKLPIHRDDAKKLGERYRLKILDLLYIKKSDSSFGENSQEAFNADEFSINTDPTESIKLNGLKKLIDFVKLNDTPIFTNNTKNSNLLGLSIENNNSYWTANVFKVLNKKSNLYLAQQKDNILKLISDSLGKDFKYVEELIQNLNKQIKEAAVNYPDLTPEQLEAKKLELKKEIEQIKSNIVTTKLDADKRDNTEFIGFNLNVETPDVFSNNTSGPYNKKNAIETINIANSQLMNLKVIELVSKINYFRDADYRIPLSRIPSLVEFLIKMNSIDPAKVKQQIEIVPGHRGPDNVNIQQELFDLAYKTSINLNIKALPFFHISHTFSINKPALVLSKKLTTIGLNQTSPTTGNSNIYDYFSGLYRIFGFRHVISTNECYSEFNLVKNIPTQQEIAQMAINPDELSKVKFNIIDKQVKTPPTNKASNTGIEEIGGIFSNAFI